MFEKTIAGIDLGTTYSALAYINQLGVPEIVANAEGDRITPSIVLFDEEEIIVGLIAKQNAIVHAEQIVEFVKRQMGKTADEWYMEYKGKKYTAEDVSSLIVRKLRNDAEQKLNLQFGEVVITVPAYFNDLQRSATMRAGELAGMKVLRIVNEPTAAALAYGVDKAGRDQRVLVFDLGGGTFDVTIMNQTNKHLQMIATNGDHMLGGKDWDDEIIKYVSEKFQESHGIDPLDELQSYQDLQARAVQAKEALSSLKRATISINYSGRALGVEVTRDVFEQRASHLTNRCKTLTEIVLDEAGMKPAMINTVLLAGGSTRMPMIRQMLRDFFHKELDTSVNPDECVAKGAAILGAITASEDGRVSRRIPKFFGGVTSTDVNSHSLGIVTLKDRRLHNSVILPKNHAIPCEKNRSDYVTTHDSQTSLDIYLIQGEDPDPENCTLLGVYEFFDIPPRPAGESRLMVTFQYNVNGMVEVVAKDLLTNKNLPRRIKRGEFDLKNLSVGSNPQDVALLIDCSGSMCGQKIQDAQNAALRFAENFNLGPNRIGVVSFGGIKAIKECDLTADYELIRSNITKLHAGGGNPMWDAIDVGDQSVFDNDDERLRVFIVVADGDPGDATKTLESATRVKNKGARIIAVGVGEGVDDEFLRKIVSSPGDYYFVTDSFQLGETFVNIATELASQLSRI